MTTTKRKLQQRWKEAPGSEILVKLNDFFTQTVAAPAARRSADHILELLQRVPLREEVPGGRDLRGAVLAAAADLDLSHFDLSHATVVNLIRCDLRDARFDGSSGDASNFGGSNLDGTTFRKAKLPRFRASQAQLRNSNFEGAELSGSSFQGCVLTGTSFKNAKCKRVNFSKADLRGCDFGGALLDEASFVEAMIDRTTNFRGASLLNATAIPARDRVPGAPLSAEDFWRAGTWDDSTRGGVDAAQREADVIDALLAVLHDTGTAQAERVAEHVRRTRAELSRLGDAWGRALFDAVTPEDRPFTESAVSRALKRLD